MIWENPEWFWALLIIPVVTVYKYWAFKTRRTGAILFSRTKIFNETTKGWRAYGAWVTGLFQLIAVILIITALARPQIENVTIERSVEGIDMVLVIDISSSMLAEDLKPNRLEAVKAIAEEFVEQRVNDRIGLVVFARESITLVPPTLDHRLVRTQLQMLDLGIVRDGTAIGMGVATALNRLRDSDAESRVIILLTDGENNAGEIDPITSAQMARAMGVRMHIIGASTEGTAPYPVDDPVFGRRYFNIAVDIDEPLMTEMAEMTGGIYLRARDNEELRRVYRELDELETSQIDELIYFDRHDRYMTFLVPGMIFLLLSFVLDKTIFRIGF